MDKIILGEGELMINGEKRGNILGGKVTDRYYYGVKYFSNILETYEDMERIDRYIISDTKLKKGDIIIVEKMNHGLFIAKVIESRKQECLDLNFSKETYRFYEKMPSTYRKYINNWKLNEKKRRKKQELLDKMDDMMENLDNELKLKYYSSMNDEFKKIYDEYKEL